MVCRKVAPQRGCGCELRFKANSIHEVGIAPSPTRRLQGWPPGGIVLPVSFQRITVDPDTMGGVPCIRGLRVPVATVVGMVADGMSHQEILEAMPDLVAEDIQEALQYASAAVRERELPLRRAQ